jgi:hypothetical protein
VDNTRDRATGGKPTARPASPVTESPPGDGSYRPALASSRRADAGKGIVLRSESGFGWMALLGGLGAAWGAVAYAIMWGYTSIVVTRNFVDSLPGLASLLPVRVVLYSIHILEGLAGHPFDFSRNHGWIGLVAATSGALMLMLPFLLVRGAVRRRTRAGWGA